MKIAENFLIAPLFFCLLTFSNALTSSRIGVVYGTQGTNFPPINYTVQLLEIKNAGFVKLRDANHEILKSLSQKSVRVSISIANNFLVHIASNQTFANQWVQENVLAYYPDTMIRFILVGQEVLSQNDTTLWYNLVPAMRRILDSVRSHNIHNIKVGTPLAMDILESTFPPSSGKFRSDIPHDQIIIPLLQFLNQTKSYFFLNVFPYFTWSANPTNVSLDLALFRGDKNSSYRDPESGLIYTNLLDQMLDSVLFASQNLGLDHVALAISETGWPHAGDIDQPGANRYNAATYNRNLVHRMSAKPPIGTPARPGVFIPTFIYALFDEDQIPGRGTARHFGILRANSRPVYDLDLTGKLGERDYPPLPLPSNNEPFKGNLWCVVTSEANIMELVPQLESVCNLGNGICDALSPGNDCYEPVTIRAHASYAFSSYWVRFRSRGAACHFNGLAVLTTTDPSHGSCKFPSVYF